jgi:hypothetical protein
MEMEIGGVEIWDLGSGIWAGNLEIGGYCVQSGRVEIGERMGQRGGWN